MAANQETLVSGVYEHESYGRVKVTVRSRSRNICGRWRYDRLEVSVPPGLPHSELASVLEKWKPRFASRLAEASRKSFYNPGQRLEFDHFSVTIVVNPNLHPGRLGVKRSEAGYVLSVAANLDFADTEVSRNITTLLERVAAYEARTAIIDMAHAEADRLGVHPEGWQIGRGHRVLGTCNARGIITLSHCLLFMPADLRQLIICHELAHLSELNHSKNFHAILDSYLDGREKELNRKLKNFKWPVYY